MRASADTYGSPLRTRDTVPRETPASSATSRMVARRGRVVAMAGMLARTRAASAGLADPGVDITQK
ncbi:hypothetical protein GCM10010972_12790 [Cellulomonas carbonis]|nr:hypothetical protein GCM10010972_12790 [Cellulomonas carbonis]